MESLNDIEAVSIVNARVVNRLVDLVLNSVEVVQLMRLCSVEQFSLEVANKKVLIEGFHSF